jgi:anti-anti-sigma regulatory factor
MTFRIETAEQGRLTVFVLSGQIDTQAIAELTRLIDFETDLPDIVLDLKDVRVIDREAVRFFMRYEQCGVRLENCTPYIREWIERERD